MTSSDAAQAHQVLEDLVRALDPEKLRQLIDIPMEATATRLLQQPSNPETTKEFNLAIRSFVRDLLAKASLSKLVLPMEEAFSTAVETLNYCYGSPGHGYEDALVDVLQNGSQTMEVILQSMAGAMKERERADHIRWVQCTCLEPLSWSARCAMVELINQIQKSTAGRPMFDGPPGRFAGELHDLVSAHIAFVYATQFCSAKNAFDGTH